MGLLRNIKIKRALKEIQDDVDKELIELNLLKIENNKKIYTGGLGSYRAVWEIQKRLLKERYNIDWKTPEEEHPERTYD